MLVSLHVLGEGGNVELRAAGRFSRYVAAQGRGRLKFSAKQSQ